MNMLNKLRETAATTRARAAVELPPVPPPSLMPGNEDPDSELYVPEEYREHYLAALAEARKAVINDTELAIKRAAHALVDKEVDEKMPLPELPPPSRLPGRITEGSDEYRETVNARNGYRLQRVEQLVAFEHDRLRSLAIHWRAVPIAMHKHQSEIERAKRAEYLKRKATCPICGTHANSPSKGGPVDSRRLNRDDRSMYATGGTLRSCRWCYDEALEQLREWRAAEATTDHRHPTRESAVRAALAAGTEPRALAKRTG